MNNRQLAELFDEFVYGTPIDTMDDAHQAQYDWDGHVPENEDPADWQKLKRIEANKVG